jgi:phosphatidylserine/phosphatidylglycerophosphate/cardiolipin synthase-like enzyme
VTPPELDAAFRKTLEDSRLSAGERRALGQLIADAGLDAHKLGVYRSQAFELAHGVLSDPEAGKVLDWLEEVVKLLQPRPPAAAPSRPAEALFSPEDDCPRRIAYLIEGARHKLDICVFTITDDRISSAILQAHRRGVLVRVITDNDKAFDAGSDVAMLRAEGVPLRVDNTPYHMHHKFALFDGGSLLNGSYNWTRGAASHNRENFLLTSDSHLVGIYARYFERLWRELGPSNRAEAPSPR